jgi:hypothetical protein
MHRESVSLPICGVATGLGRLLVSMLSRGTGRGKGALTIGFWRGFLVTCVSISIAILHDGLETCLVSATTSTNGTEHPPYRTQTIGTHTATS